MLLSCGCVGSCTFYESAYLAQLGIRGTGDESESLLYCRSSKKGFRWQLSVCLEVFLSVNMHTHTLRYLETFKICRTCSCRPVGRMVQCSQLRIHPMMSKGPFKCFITLFSWKFDPQLRYVTLSWPPCLDKINANQERHRSAPQCKNLLPCSVSPFNKI